MATQTEETKAKKTVAATPTPEVQPAPAPTPKRGRPPNQQAAPTPVPVTVQVVPSPAVAATVEPAKTVTPPKEKPAPSGVTIETSQLVRAIGAIVLGMGILGLTIWWFGSDFIVMALYIALPLLIIFVGLRLMSYGTLQLIWNGELKERVTTYLTSLETVK
jgi:hypothetical protein